MRGYGCLYCVRFFASTGTCTRVEVWRMGGKGVAMNNLAFILDQSVDGMVQD